MGSGILLIDKAGGMTSHDVVARARRLAGTRKIGHAGTLDPMATGLLILGVDSSTRLLTYLVGQDKEYLATIRLGQSTSTDDADGEIVTRADATAIAAIDDAEIAEIITTLSGEIEQIPSSVSAIKVDGKRAYDRVRDGETVELKARPVTVSRFEVRERRAADDGSFVELDVVVECSSGTYIRALARDLGVALGVGGHLTALRRTRIGPFSVEDAAPIDDLDVPAALIGPVAAASTIFPVVNLDRQQAIDLGHGKRIDAAPLRELLDDDAGGLVAAVTPDQTLLGLIELRGTTAKSVINFPDDERELKA